VYAVVENEYKLAIDLAVAFATALDSLPNIGSLTLSDGDLIYNLRDGYNAMSAYQQGFISAEMVDKLREYVVKIEELRAIANGGAGDPPPTEPTDPNEPTDPAV